MSVVSLAARGAPLPHGRGPERITIGDTALIDVVEPGAPTAIVFSAVNARSFSYYKMFMARPLNRVFLRDPDNLWYQRGVSAELSGVEPLAAYLAEVLRVLKPSTTIAFGSSMGGYASLLFGQKLDVDAVVSICPQTLLDPRLPHTPAAAPNGPYDDLSGLPAPAPRRKTYVFFGSADMVDIYNVYRMPQDGLTLLPIAGQDHMVMHHLMKNGEFERCVDAILAGRDYACSTPLDRRCDDPLLRGLVGRLVEGVYREDPAYDPERYARATLALQPDWPAANYMLARVWADQGKLEEAAKQAAKATKRAPGSIAFADFQAHLFLRREMYDEALAAYERCLEVRPKHYAALCALASLHARAGRTEIALRLLDDAVEIRPRQTRAQKLRDKIKSGRFEAGRTDVALDDE
ncbi:tetratricopeptide repeat protein [Methylopila henanensis]|uniref:Tetratricopeptide repeat protein n=1 Tax=Methylopila henanensis TaxID=873516 RepID=A0ABW4KC83_9HYPH